jgi:ribosomal protein L37AE/L43A
MKCKKCGETSPILVEEGVDVWVCVSCSDEIANKRKGIEVVKNG